MFETVETQVVQALGGLLVLGVTTALGYLAPHAKAWFKAHTSAKVAATATQAIDGLSTIAQSVVADLNQRVVADAKTHGVWNAQLAQQVKYDAVQSVMSQGGALVALASKTVGNVQDLVSSLIEKAVASSITQLTTGAAQVMPSSTTVNVNATTSSSAQEVASTIASAIQNGQVATSTV